MGLRRPAADEVLSWPAEELRPDLEWLLSMATPNGWTAGQMEYDVADTPENRARLERLAAEPLLGLFASDFEVVEVRPCDVQQVPRLSRPRPWSDPPPQVGFEDLDPARRFGVPRGAGYLSVGRRARLSGTFFAPTAGVVQQVDVLLPDRIGSRLASMFIHAVDGDLALTQLTAEVYDTAKVRGRRATLRVPDTKAGRRVLDAMAQVGLASDTDGSRARPVLDDEGGQSDRSWLLRVARNSWEGHRLMFVAAATRGANRGGVRTLPAPPALVEPNAPPASPDRLVLPPRLAQSTGPAAAPQLSLF